jgi:membrane protease YdiL (CAAX protease family)
MANWKHWTSTGMRRRGRAPVRVAPAPTSVHHAIIPVSVGAASIDTGQPPAERARIAHRAVAALLVAGSILVGAELLIVSGRALMGQVLDATLVVVVLNVGTAGRNSQPQAEPTVLALHALALVAALRVLGLGLPLRGWNPAFGVLVIAASTVYAVIWAAPALGIARRAFLGPTSPAVVMVSALAGIALGLVAVMVGAPTSAHSGARPSSVLLGAAAVTAAAVAEELLYRGAVGLTSDRVLARFGLLFTSLLFAVSYAGFHSMGLVLVMAMAGVVFGWAVGPNGSLRAAIVGHIALALSAAVAWPLVVNPNPGRSVSVPGLVVLAVVLLVLSGVVLTVGRGRFVRASQLAS